MSFRYPNGSFIKPGLNTLASPTLTYTYELWSWGQNSFGQLGLGNRTNYSSPKQVGSLTDWDEVYGAKFNNCFAIKTDGTLWAWGFNIDGSLGLGNTTRYSSPKQVGSLTNWSSVSNGYFHTLAIKTDGTLWSWGRNNFGQLGLGNTTNYSSPKQVGSLTNWLQVAAGYSWDGGTVQASYSLAIKTDGTLWAWGTNSYGQLGLGNTTNYSSPKQVGALNNWSKVYTNGVVVASTAAIKTDGTIWSWGNGALGALGLGNSTSYSSPKQVGSLTNWLKAAAGYQSRLVIKTDGTLWAWGYNNAGQLGQGDITNRNSPVQVGALTNWLDVAAGYNHMLATKIDGTLWSWGSNGNGQLGLGNTTYYSSPKQVGSLTNWFGPATSGRSSFCLKY